jgi:hypothetical protein
MAKRALFHHAFDVIIHSLLLYKDNRFDLQTNNGDLWCFSYMGGSQLKRGKSKIFTNFGY